MNIQPPILTDKKIDRIIKVFKVVVAVGGIEPPSHSPQELVLNRPFHWDDLLLSALYQLSHTTYRTIIMRSGFPAPLCLTMWRIKPPPTGGRFSSPRLS